MKKLIYLITIFCFIYSDSRSQWVVQNLPPASGNYEFMLCINFNDQEHGITGGFHADVTIQQYNGLVYYTNDGGNNWIESLVPDSARFIQKVQIINDSLAYGAGSYNKTPVNFRSDLNKSLPVPVSGGYFVESTDGGVTWHPKGTFEDSIYILTGMSFLNQQTGYVIGTYPDSISYSILKTTDGGNSWSYVYPLTNFLRLNDISFIDDQHGIAVGERVTGQGVVLRTTDGGQSWTENDLSNIFVVLTCKYVDVNTILISGYTVSVSDVAFIYKSTDSGVSWSTFRTYINHGIEGVDEFQNSGIILVYGAYLPEFYNIPFFDISFDGGNTWTYNQYPQYQYYIFTGSKMVSESRWYLSGTANSFPGIVLFTDNSGGVPVELTSFNAQAGAGNVELNWQTATETNNKGFEVERSQISEVKSQTSDVGGQISEWGKIGFVEGAGTSTLLHSYSFTDRALFEGRYNYRLKQIDFDGSYKYSNVVSVDMNSPQDFSLNQNYPNPFNPTTKIGFSIKDKTNVKITIFNTIGEQVATLLNEEKDAGYYQIDFNAADLPSGVYFYQMEAGNYLTTRKMTLVK